MRQEAAGAVLRFFAAVDARKWDEASALMTDPFRLDYSSFGGGPVADLAPSDILTGWKAMLPGFDATHHQLGPLDVAAPGDSASAAPAPASAITPAGATAPAPASVTVHATVTAAHHIAGAEGGDLWTVFGSYEIVTRREDDAWRLSALTFHFSFQAGNPDLPALAQARAAPAQVA